MLFPPKYTGFRCLAFSAAPFQSGFPRQNAKIPRRQNLSACPRGIVQHAALRNPGAKKDTPNVSCAAQPAARQYSRKVARTPQKRRSFPALPLRSGLFGFSGKPPRKLPTSSIAPCMFRSNGRICKYHISSSAKKQGGISPAPRGRKKMAERPRTKSGAFFRYR